MPVHPGSNVEPPPSATILEEAWKNGVRRDLFSGNLFYEEDAQASLYHHFRTHAKSEPYVIHVNALKHRVELERQSPDIIVTSGDRIQALVEVKFAPWMTLRQLVELCRADVAKLNWVAQRSDQAGGLAFSLQLEPGRWSTDENAKRDINIDTAFILAVVAQAGDDAGSMLASLRESWKGPGRLWILAGLLGRDEETSLFGLA